VSQPSAIILAGGRGSRFGSPLKCTPFLPRLARCLREAGCQSIVIAGDHDGLDVPGCLRTRDAIADCGPLAGLVGAFDAVAHYPAALVVAGDMFALRARDLRRLIGAWRRTGRAVVAMPQAVSQPPFPALLGVLPVQTWALARTQLERRRLGMHRLWRSCAAKPVWFPTARLADGDRPHDLLRIHARSPR
jgi:molybdopterin-guanine dinucleotide biosynthesis protein A